MTFPSLIANNLAPNRSWGVRYFAADGSVVDLTDTSRYIAVDRKGFGMPKHSFLSTKGVSADGAFLSRVTLDPRDLAVTVWLLNRVEPMNALRQKLVSAFDPGLGPGQLEYRDNELGKTWTANVLPQALPLDTSPGQAKALQVVMVWTAFDPYFYGPIESEELTPDGTSVFVTLGGGLSVGWTLSAPGPLRNPSFQNLTSGEGVSFAFYIAPDKTLLVTNKPGQKTAYVVDQVYPFGQTPIYIDRTLNSTYWKLAVGENEVRLESTPLQPAQAEATLSWQSAVKGV